MVDKYSVRTQFAVLVGGAAMSWATLIGFGLGVGTLLHLG